MKEKLTAKAVLIPTVSLFLICLIATLLLAVTNQVTAPKIAALSAENEEAARKVVLGTADSFGEAQTVELDGAAYTYYTGLDAQGGVIGYVFTTQSKGYGGDVKMMTGVQADGTVAGVKPLELNETAGLGMRAQEPSFLEQYTGKSGTVGVNKNAPGDNEIQALTGATITSRAVTQAVNTALALYAEITGGVQ